MTAALHEYVARQAERRPDAVAVVMGEQRLTYAQLEAASNRLARLLEREGCGPGDRVGLFVPKSPAALVGMLGTLKAGGAYVPVDLASPAARLEKVVRSAEPRLLLAAAPAVAVLDELYAAGALGAGRRIVSVDEDPVAGERFASTATARDLQALSPEAAGWPGAPEDLAHILFTSGSTGVPKGVTITHGNVIAFVEWATRYFGTAPSDRISGHPPLHFDLSTFDIYGTWAAGAQLHLVPPEASLLPHRLAEFIRSSELTQWFSVPSILTYMAKFDAVAHGDFPALERLLWCGEVLPTPILRRWMERLPSVAFTNLYGPTEATIASSYHTLSRRPATDTESVPIGVACAGEELLVLDDALRPAAAGETGDLFIAGAGLSPGYWRDPEKTRGAFLPDPRAPESGRRIYRTGDRACVGEDGLVTFLGRADSQIKSRGYRIEPGEIEAVLNSLDGLREVAVVGVQTEGFEGVAIACAYVLAPGAEWDPGRLRAEVRTVLPSYMVPARWMALEGLPKNVNGKIDRPRIRDLFAQEAAHGRAAEVGT